METTIREIITAEVVMGIGEELEEEEGIELRIEEWKQLRFSIKKR